MMPARLADILSIPLPEQKSVHLRHGGWLIVIGPGVQTLYAQTLVQGKKPGAGGIQALFPRGLAAGPGEVPQMCIRDSYDTSWPIFARSATKPPHFTGPDARVSHSMVTGGCEVYGTVENSVLFHSVTVEKGAKVRYSILMPGAVVKEGAEVSYAIVAERAVIGAGARVGAPPDPEHPSDDWGIAVVAEGIRVGDGATVGPKAMVTRNVKGGGAK